MGVLEDLSAAYPNAVKHMLPDGTIVFTAEIIIGGIDGVGPYALVLEGPAVGERVYDF